ncbi:ABC transporter ATP-binding protein [Halogeometricum borinquense]|uniref:Molybdate/tungstate import ATP-binding protein WtpC n=1 Tax=Halogeometricum borinquense TaxID=60847 RepID=A0A6C0UEJ9_9EURY|nr:ABC transporter ATP-binding protein [Halogeometricum borinquense]QIB73862.1 ABC transporter ATP-binding protein [Halogeometricum borinquense]QIQ76776.1 ABC transporter ATP-binding protein [Halogeometricum borinquense]
MTLSVDVEATFTARGADPFTTAAAFEVKRGETAVVLGPSGSGKSLLLETVAGFHSHDGSVALDGTDLTSKAPENRRFGFVFQNYMLFPNMTVAENVRYGDRYHETTGDAVELLAELGISDLADRYPQTLSGGEKQRVALARSLYVRPDVLLLDEPLSALDVPTQTRLRQDMLDVLDGVTAVYVTHDRTTARTLADRILVMNEGRIVQRGTPDAVFARPTSQFVAQFTGSNCVPLDTDDLRGAVDGSGNAEYLAVRPENVRLDNGSGDVTATVERVVREDAAFRVTLAVSGHRIDAYTTDPPAPGSSVGVSFEESASTLL